MPEINGLVLTVKAAGAITVRRCVGFDDAQATVQGQKVKGVALMSGQAGEFIPAAASDTCLVEAGAAFPAGASLICDSQARAIASTGGLALKAGATAVTSTAANGAVLQGGDPPEFVFADALEAATAPGVLVEVLFRR